MKNSSKSTISKNRTQEVWRSHPHISFEEVNHNLSIFSSKSTSSYPSLSISASQPFPKFILTTHHVWGGVAKKALPLTCASQAAQPRKWRGSSPCCPSWLSPFRSLTAASPTAERAHHRWICCSGNCRWTTPCHRKARGPTCCHSEMLVDVWTKNGAGERWQHRDLDKKYVVAVGFKMPLSLRKCGGRGKGGSSFEAKATRMHIKPCAS